MPPLCIARLRYPKTAIFLPLFGFLNLATQRSVVGIPDLDVYIFITFERDLYGQIFEFHRMNLSPPSRSLRRG